MNHLRRQLVDELRRQLMNHLRWQLMDELRWQLVDELWRQLMDELWRQLLHLYWKDELLRADRRPQRYIEGVLDRHPGKSCVDQRRKPAYEGCPVIVRQFRACHRRFRIVYEFSQLFGVSR